MGVRETQRTSSRKANHKVIRSKPATKPSGMVNITRIGVWIGVAAIEED